MNTNYFIDLVAGNLYGTKKTPAIPGSFYLGLSTSAPSATGSNVTEPHGNGYTRIKLTNLSTPSSGVVKNSIALDFPESTGSWGRITHFVIYDAASAGNLLSYGALAQPKTIDADTTMTIKPGALKLSVQNIA